MCIETTSAAAPTESSIVLAADISGQPLTRADCGRAGMRWNEGANVCTESNSTAAQSASRPVSTSGTKTGSRMAINIDKTTKQVASQAGPGRTPGRKPMVASWAGPGSRYAQGGPSWYGRESQRPRGFFGRLFGGP